MWVKSTKKSNAVAGVPPVSNQELLLDALKSLPLPWQLDTAHDVSATKQTRCKPLRITCDNSPSCPHSKTMASYCRTAAYCGCLPVSPSLFPPGWLVTFPFVRNYASIPSFTPSFHPSTWTPKCVSFLVFAHSNSFSIILVLMRTLPNFLAFFLRARGTIACQNFLFFSFPFFWGAGVSQAMQLSLMNQVWAEVIYFLSGWKLSKLVNNLPSFLRSLTVMETRHWSFSEPWSQVRRRVPWMTHMVLWSWEWAISLYDGKPLGPEAHLRWSWWMASARAHMCTHTHRNFHW